MKIISCSAAKAAGLKRYFTGKPCRHGHISERHVGERMCVECMRLRGIKNNVRFADYYAKYREQHRDKSLAYNRAAYAAEADQRREYARQYRRENAEAVRAKDRQRCSSDARKATRSKSYAKHGDKKRKAENCRYLRDADRIKARVKKYRDENPAKVRDQRRPGLHAARARKKAAEGKFTTADVKRMHVAQNFICAACPSDISVHYHVDHMTPLAHPLRGTNWPSNLQLLCGPCNRSKGAKTMAEWIAWKAVSEAALSITDPDSLYPSPSCQ